MKIELPDAAKTEQMLKLREELLAVEEDRLNGLQDYSGREVVKMMRDITKETVERGKPE